MMFLSLLWLVACATVVVGQPDVGVASDTWHLEHCLSGKDPKVWDTSRTLIITFEGQNLEAVKQQLELLRSLREVLSTANSLTKWLSYAFSDVIFTITDENFRNVTNDDERITGFVAHSLQEVNETLARRHTSWSDALKRAVLFSVDPAGVVSSAGATAGSLALEGLDMLAESSGMVHIAEYLGLNANTTDSVLLRRAAQQLKLAIAAASKAEGLLKISPYKTHYIVLHWEGAQHHHLRVSCRINPIAIRFPVKLLAGIFLFREAGTLASSAMVYYGSGAAIGGLLSFCLLAYFLFRHRTNKIVLGGGFAAFVLSMLSTPSNQVGHDAKLETFHWIEQFLGLPSGSISYLFVLYILGAAVVVGLWLYISGPVENPRLINVITFAWRCVGIALMYAGTQSTELSFGIILSVLSASVLGNVAADVLFWTLSPFQRLTSIARSIARVIRILSCNLCCRSHGHKQVHVQQPPPVIEQPEETPRQQPRSRETTPAVPASREWRNTPAVPPSREWRATPGSRQVRATPRSHGTPRYMMWGGEENDAARETTPLRSAPVRNSGRYRLPGATPASGRYSRSAAQQYYEDEASADDEEEDVMEGVPVSAHEYYGLEGEEYDEGDAFEDNNHDNDHDDVSDDDVDVRQPEWYHDRRAQARYQPRESATYVSGSKRNRSRFVEPDIQHEQEAEEDYEADHSQYADDEEQMERMVPTPHRRASRRGTPQAQPSASKRARTSAQKR